MKRKITSINIWYEKRIVNEWWIIWKKNIRFQNLNRISYITILGHEKVKSRFIIKTNWKRK